MLAGSRTTRDVIARGPTVRLTHYPRERRSVDFGTPDRSDGGDRDHECRAVGAAPCGVKRDLDLDQTAGIDPQTVELGGAAWVLHAGGKNDVDHGQHTVRQQDDVLAVAP